MVDYVINAKRIDQDHKVWIVYSGSRRRFLRSFRENSVVFLQTPGFSPYPGIFDDITEIRRHLRMADQVYRWVIGAREDPPNRNPRSFSGELGRTKEAGSRRFNQEVGNVQRLFRDVQAGDLVLSPPIGHYDDMLIGEVVSPWSQEQVAAVSELGDELVPHRRVQWFQKNLSRRDFPPGVARALQNPHAVSEVDHSYYREIYKAVYSAFIWGSDSKLDFSAEQYSSHDPLETFEGAFLIKYFISAYCARSEDSLGDFAELSPEDAVREFYSREYVAEFTQNFNSPGKFSLVASAATLAIVVGVAVSAMVGTVDEDSVLGSVNIISGSGGLQDSEVEEIRETVRDLIDGIGRDRLQEVKDNYGNGAREKLQLTPELGP